MKSENAERYLRPLLEYFWLRPETAVWRTLDCVALDGIEFRGPSLDLGCGDGAFSFLRAGGRYRMDYDFASEASNLDKFFANADIYDNANPTLTGDVVDAPPQYTFTYGFDHKIALLMKADKTGLYEHTTVGDGNEPLPFARGTFQSVYSNILYWLESYRDTLASLYDVIRPGGQLVVQVPSERFREFSFYHQLFTKTQDPAWKWLELLDRGRMDNIKNCQTEAEWSADFNEAGFEVERCTPYLSKLVIQAWDIGLRPLSPMLIEMANALDGKKRQEIKRKWVDNLLPLLLPLCNMPSDQNGFYLFALRRL